MIRRVLAIAAIAAAALLGIGCRPVPPRHWNGPTTHPTETVTECLDATGTLIVDHPEWGCP